jgi:hypothetical protein
VRADEAGGSPSTAPIALPRLSKTRTRSASRASLDSASCDARTPRRAVRPESCRRYDEDAPPGVSVGYDPRARVNPAWVSR